MAIEQTGAIYKTLTFDGESSGTYGVYITGEAVYNAPEREVEMISIPGRSGQLALDKGRFENIEVTYPAGIFADNEEDFAEGISNFRNFLCSRNGYVRLQDDYNPNEYRLAIYKSGLEVDNALHRAGEFDIVFDCKPQRYLTSGETAIEVDSGDVITNPTLFDASPLLEVEGDGTVGFNGYSIELDGSQVVGNVQLSPAVTDRWTNSNVYYDGSLLEQGDTITVHGNRIVKFEARLKDTAYKAVGHTLTRTSANIPGTFSYSASGAGSPLEGYNFVLTYAGDETFAYGNTVQIDDMFTLQISRQPIGGGSVSTVSVTIQVSFFANSSFINFIVPAGQTAYDIIFTALGTYSFGTVTGYSTQSVLSGQTYIDCDLGEAFKIVDGEAKSLNAYIDLGSDLPVLAPGANTITFDNTITDLKVVPRWWKI